MAYKFLGKKSRDTFKSATHARNGIVFETTLEDQQVADK